ncbi:unnamed protein product [Periconia digitata]|uniref:Fungal N-terminal domain-containing protein n=1 Tax=Periconia digitata TaxID=1303443 RepID=A0A9W4XQA7_9PLEO|nr:unnamed protein product [Periconia digitata]
MATPTTGDILLLSQTAWKIGRAFIAGGANAPAEFHEVETQINALARALKLLAETMFSEEADILRVAHQHVQKDFSAIVHSCQQPIEDLDSLMDQYQVIKKTRTTGGFAIERSWSDLVVAQYQTMMWTTEGGNIFHLMGLLKMRTHMISLVRQALLRQDPRHDFMIIANAIVVDNIHHRTGTLSQEIDKANSIVQDIANQASRSLTNDSPLPSVDASTARESFSAQQFLPQRHSSKSSRSSPPMSSRSAQSSQSTMLTPSMRASPPKSPNRTPTHLNLSDRRPPSIYTDSEEDSDPESGNETIRFGYLASHETSTSLLSSKTDSHQKDPRSRPDSCTLSPRLAPPMAAMEFPPPLEVEEGMSHLEIHPVIRHEVSHRHRSATTSSQRHRFEKAAFANSAILCDVSGIAVEYAQKVSSEADAHDVEMIEACQNCRICVVRKREASSEARDDIRLMTSIWVFSDDDTLRLELKMADGEMYVPYASYFSPEKVSLTVPCELKFHDVQYGQRVLKTAKTTWINYVFDSIHAATLFQNELMGRSLLATFRTSQTLRIHQGLSGAFSYAEQMCGMENLRIWEDEDTLAVIALIHFSPQFRKGYLAFYLNSSNTPIKVKDEGGREVKVKGLRVPLDKAALRKDSIVAGDADDKKSKGKKWDASERKKFVTGARIEFASEAEKRDFIRLVWDVQENMRELPSLSGVN